MAKPKALLRPRRAGLTGWRRALVLLALVAFALQSYVVQTHIHLAPRDLALLTAGGGKGGHHDKFPENDDPANCPICQEVIHSGVFVAPPAPVILLPTQFVWIILAVEQPRFFISAFSHSWQGRAPPST